MLERVWRKGNPLTLLVRVQTSTATMENSVEIPLKPGTTTAISSVQFSHSVMSNSLWPHGLQHTRPPCPSPNLEFTQTHFHCVGDAINDLVLCCPFLLPCWIFPSIRVFSGESVLCIRWPKDWSFNFSISPSNEYSRLISFRMTGWISLQSKGLSRVFSNTTVQKHQLFGTQLSLQSNSHIHTWLLEKP